MVAREGYSLAMTCSRPRTRTLALASLLGVVAACSQHTDGAARVDTGSDGAAGTAAMPLDLSCRLFDECGGDLTGTWSVASGCFTDMGACPGTNTIGTETSTGLTQTFDASGAFSTSSALSHEHQSGTVPLSCLATGADCSSAVPTAKATNVDGVCTWSFDSDTTYVVAHGTYASVSSTRFTLTVDGEPAGAARTIDFCVEGNVARMHWTEPQSGSTDRWLVLTR